MEHRAGDSPGRASPDPRPPAGGKPALEPRAAAAGPASRPNRRAGEPWGGRSADQRWTGRRWLDRRRRGFPAGAGSGPGDKERRDAADRGLPPDVAVERSARRGGLSAQQAVVTAREAGEVKKRGARRATAAGGRKGSGPAVAPPKESASRAEAPAATTLPSRQRERRSTPDADPPEDESERRGPAWEAAAESHVVCYLRPRTLPSERASGLPDRRRQVAPGRPSSVGRYQPKGNARR